MLKRSKVRAFAALSLAASTCCAATFIPLAGTGHAASPAPPQADQASATGPRPSPTPTPKTASQLVVIYGDSLTVESEPALSRLAHASSLHVVFRAFGGTALCDWTAQAARDRLALHPSSVVLAFTGNTASCVSHDYLSLGVPGAIANYRRALVAMRKIYPTESMTVVLSPAMQNLPNGWFPFNGSPALNAMYRQTASQLHLSADSAADELLTPDHVFAWMRPLTSGGASVLVRLSDGVHLTPAGATLYARALLEGQNA